MNRELTPADKGRCAAECMMLCNAAGRPVTFVRQGDGFDLTDVSVSSLLKVLELAWEAGFIAASGGAAPEVRS